MAQETKTQDNVTRMEHERITRITRNFRWAKPYGELAYETIESIEFNEDVPRKAILAEQILLGIKVKQVTLMEALADGALSEEAYYEFMKGTHTQFIRGLKLITEVREDYLDAMEAVKSVSFIREELVRLGIMKKKQKKE